MIEFSQCYPGFLYSKESQRCECYSNNEIVSYSGSSSTIKRGYWFGSINGKSTVTSCPNNFVTSPVVKLLMAFIIFHLLELTSVDHTELVLLVETARKGMLYHLILLNASG